MPNLRRVGQEAEDRAADYLLEEGFTLVTRRYKARHGEIDLVALDGDTLVFVEVKHRRGALSPEASLTPSKVSSLVSAVQEYVAAMGVANQAMRFDVVAIDRQGLRHYRNAFASHTSIAVSEVDEELWEPE